MDKQLKSDLESKNIIIQGLEHQLNDFHTNLTKCRTDIVRKYFEDSDDISYDVRYWGIGVKIKRLFDRFASMEIKFYEKYDKNNDVNLIDNIKICLNGCSFGNEDEVLEVLAYQLKVTNILKENKKKLIKGLNTQTIAFNNNMQKVRAKLRIARKDQYELQVAFDEIEKNRILSELENGYEYSRDGYDRYPYIQVNSKEVVYRVSFIRLVSLNKSGKTCQVCITQTNKRGSKIVEDEYTYKMKVPALIEFIKENKNQRKI